MNPYQTNMVSINVLPDDNSTDPLLGGADILLVSNDQSDYYVPSFDVDQIGSFEVTEAFNCFLNGGVSQTLFVEGLPADVSTEITLNAFAINLLSFLPQECMATSDVFAGYEDDILIVKSDQSDYYVPSYNVETLSEMCPGEAYALFLSGSAGMDFTYPSWGLASNHSSDIMDDYKLRTRRSDVALTGESHLVLLTDLTGEVEAGDILRAYANDKLVGSINIIPEHLDGTYPIDLVAVGGVDFSMYDGPELFGYESGDGVEVRLYSQSQGMELKVSANLDSNVYGNDAELSIGTAVVLNESATPTSVSLSQNYPNPFNPSTTISYNVEQSGHVSLNVYDVMGRLVKTLVSEYKQAGNTSGYQVVWDGLDNSGQQVSAGLYIYSLQTQGITMTEKMVLMK